MSTLTSTHTRLLINTGSTFVQAASEEGVMGQHTWGPKSQGLEKACRPIYWELFAGWQVANEI